MQSDENGILLTFDFRTEFLRKYFSRTSPHGAYGVIQRYLERHDFEHLKDTDYKHSTLTKAEAWDIVAEFAQKNKWFPLCLKKLNISPNIVRLDVSNEIKMLYSDVAWQREKDYQYMLETEKYENNFEDEDEEYYKDDDLEL